MYHTKSGLNVQPGPDRRSIPRWVVDLAPYLPSGALAVSLTLIDRATLQAEYCDEPWLLVFGGRPVSIRSLSPGSLSQTKRSLRALTDLGLASALGVPGKGTRLWVRGPKWRVGSRRVIDRLPYEPVRSHMTHLWSIYDLAASPDLTLTNYIPRPTHKTSISLVNQISNVVSMSYRYDPSIPSDQQTLRCRRGLQANPLCGGWRVWIDTLPRNSDPEAIKTASYKTLRQIATGRTLDHEAQIRYLDYVYRKVAGRPLLRLLDRVSGDID